MCAAVLGQCGPRVPRFKSLFHSQRYCDDHCFLKGDRHVELLSMWQEIGDDKNQKLEELRQMITTAVEKIYEKALEECACRKMALEEMVTKSEHRLRELLGSAALKVIAPKELPLQVRLSMNKTRLQDIENAKLGGYGWVGGLVVLVELRRRVVALREMLKLPPCDNLADLDEVLASTTDALINLCSGNVSVQTLLPAKCEQKTNIFERLERFYQTLCAIENNYQDEFAPRDTGKDVDYRTYCKTSSRLTLDELELKVIRNSHVTLERFMGERCSLPSASPSFLFGFARKRSSPRYGQRSKGGSRQSKLCTEEASKLEELSHQTLRKLEDISRQVKGASKTADIGFSPMSTYSRSSGMPFSPASGITDDSNIVKSCTTPSSMSPPSSENNSGDTPTSVLPERPSDASGVLETSHRTGSSAAHSKKETSLLLSHDKVDQSESIDECWVELYEKDLAKGGGGAEERTKGKQLELENADVTKTEHATSAATNNEDNLQQTDNVNFTVTNEQVLSAPITCKQNACKSKGISAPPNKTTPLPPRPVPPPPPPPPISTGLRRSSSTKSTKLKKSVTLSKLYIGMKKKADGAANDQYALADAAVQRRTVAGANTRDGMAEALAEITRRSSYFRKIEDDVQRHAALILDVKSGLESFETRDMQMLIRFHETIESRLELLTDESQVLGKFEGFPIKKLETVRAAASLYIRMSSLAQQIENWRIESPISEHLEKITVFFEKVKIEVETIERTKDEDIARFQSQKIIFSFDIVVRIKEAMVGLSSRSLSLALRDSQRAKASITIGDEYLSAKDLKKLRSSFQMLWRVFQLAFRVHNFAGGHDEKAEQLCCNVAKEMETYPASFWLEVVNK